MTPNTRSKATILVIDDEEDILELLSYNLTKEGYQVVTAASGEDGISAMKSAKPDLMVLDLMLPGMDGLDVCREIKGNPSSRNLPILILSAKGEEADVVAGLELGADDYVVKPFSLSVVKARIKSLLRRAKDKASPEQGQVKVDGLWIDPVRHEASLTGSKLDLTFTEFSLLHLLASNPGRVFTRYQIVDAIRGGDYPVTDRSVDVQIVGLRKKLAGHSDYVETVRGVGYRFRD